MAFKCINILKNVFTHQCSGLKTFVSANCYRLVIVPFQMIVDETDENVSPSKYIRQYSTE